MLVKVKNYVIAFLMFQPHQTQAKTRPGTVEVNFSPVSYSPL